MKKSSTKRLLSYITVHNKLLIISLLTAIINVFFTLLNPILIGDAIDFIIGKDNVEKTASFRSTPYISSKNFLVS